MFLEKLHKEEKFLARELGHNSKPEVPWLINALLNLVNFMKNHPCQSLIKFEGKTESLLEMTLSRSYSFTFPKRPKEDIACFCCIHFQFEILSEAFSSVSGICLHYFHSRSTLDNISYIRPDHSNDTLIPIIITPFFFWYIFSINLC